jgi:pimeloyl-ACP methyl ester carboxylesterase
MPIVPYLLGRPAHVWIAAMARSGSPRQTRQGTAHGEVRGQQAPGTQDQAISPDAERLFASRMGATDVEVPAGHLAMISHPDEAARLIETAAAAVS